MRLLLHGGFHKTGTTSLQAALVAHRAALAPYLQIETLRRNPGMLRATEAARAFSIGGDKVALEAAMRLWAGGLERAEGRDLVISSEDFAGHMPGRHGVVDYRAAVVTIPAAVAALAARFPGAEITVLLTTREAAPWLTSLHWQLAQHPELMLKARRFCKDYAAAARFEAITDPLCRVLGQAARLVVTPLESLARRRLGPVEAVYDLIDLPGDVQGSLPVPPRKNARPAEGLADQFVLLNRAKLPVDELARAKTAMQGLMASLDRED